MDEQKNDIQSDDCGLEAAEDQTPEGEARVQEKAPASNAPHDDAQHQQNQNGRRKIKGLFSSQTVDQVGTGTTKRKTIRKMYWFAEEKDDGTVQVQPINRNNIPSGPKTDTSREDFLKHYAPEPEYYLKEVFPRMKELMSTVKRAEEQREKGATYSASFEFNSALDIDEENVRANFGLGMTYIDRGELEKADDIFDRLVSLEAAFAPEHKHLFNEFGINLRKSGMMEQAVQYYKRALEMTDTDENLHYNLARAYFQNGNAEECMEHLKKALELNPEHDESKTFAEFLKKLAADPIQTETQEDMNFDI